MIEQLTYIRRQLEERGEQIAFERLLNVKVRKVSIRNYDPATQTVQPYLYKSMERFIAAYGQYYFLLNAAQLPVGTRITSDTNVLFIEEGLPADMVDEFSGTIQITLPPDCIEEDTGLKQVLFYQVIPGIVDQWNRKV